MGGCGVVLHGVGGRGRGEGSSTKVGSTGWLGVERGQFL